jgi:Flp pilus assembly protein TadG
MSLSALSHRPRAARVTVIVTPPRQAGPPAGASQRERRAQPMGQAGEAGERGSLTLMLAVMFVALVALAGIVIDGGAKLTAGENATAIAQEAARAGAGMVNPATAYQNGSFVVDVAQARQVAQQYLDQPWVEAGGYRGTVTRVGTYSIEVTVDVTQPTKVLSIIGIDTVSASGTATANLVSGVTGPAR